MVFANGDGSIPNEEETLKVKKIAQELEVKIQS